MIEWNKMNKFCKWSYEDTHGKQRCEKRQSHPCDYDKCPLRKEPPKITKKIFVVEYANSDPSFPHSCDILDGKTVHDLLKQNTRSCIGIKVETFDPRVWEITKISPKVPKLADGGIITDEGYKHMAEVLLKKNEKSEEPEIVKSCNNCGWFQKEIYDCNVTEPCSKYNEWKPIEKDPEIVKSCGNCNNHGYCSIKQSEKCIPFNYTYWTPIEEEKTENEENGKKEKTE